MDHVNSYCDPRKPELLYPHLRGLQMYTYQGPTSPCLPGSNHQPLISNIGSGQIFGKLNLAQAYQ